MGMQEKSKTERRWRKRSTRGVSPIIATILLVAITVVLAAVLYILISGLTHGPGNTPLGSAFAFGVPTNNSTGTTYSYGIAVASATGLTLNNLKFQVITSSGTIVTTTTYSLSVLDTAGHTIGVYSFSGAGSWTSGGSTALSTSQVFWLHATIGAGISGLNTDNVIAIGQGSFSGQVTSTSMM
jgi:archaeal type IV pilus assembly protein PilA